MRSKARISCIFLGLFTMGFFAVSLTLFVVFQILFSNATERIYLNEAFQVESLQIEAFSISQGNSGLSIVPERSRKQHILILPQGMPMDVENYTLQITEVGQDAKGSYITLEVREK